MNFALDERTDLFALGGILYRILAGRPPYTGSSSDNVLEAAARASVTSPEQVKRQPGQLPRRLVAICMKALAVDPAQRYQTAGELKKDLEEFIRGTAQLPQLTFKPGEAIVREGEHGDAAYIILDGHCQATRVVAGEHQNLRLLGPGEMFGETAVLTGAPRSATVTALVDTTVGVVDQLYLQEEMERSSFISLAIRTVASRFLDLDAQTSALMAKEKLNHVVDATLRHLALQGVDGPGGVRRTPWRALLVKLSNETGLTQEEISDRVLREPGFTVENEQLVLRP
jgi:serine/threonine-protein kinase